MKSYPKIRRLANVYAEEEGNRGDFPETIRAAEAVEKALEDILDKDTYLDIEPLLNESRAEEQDQGFIQGFCYGVQLMREVFCGRIL